MAYRQTYSRQLGLLSLGLGLWLLAGCRSEPPLTIHPGAPTAVALKTLTYPPFLIDAASAARYRQDGLGFRQAGSLDRAIAALKIAVALDPTNLDGYVLLGWTQHLAGNQVAAAQTLQAALQQKSDHIPALNALGIVYLVSGELEAAVTTHLQAVALDPNNEIAHYNLSLAYQRLNQMNNAIGHGQQAATLEPSNPHPWVALALAYWSQGDQDQAAVHYWEALKLDSRYRDRSYLDHLLQAGFSPDQIETINVIRQATL